MEVAVKLLNSLPNIFAGILIVYTSNAFAGTTFLPDWQQADLEFKRDEPLCTTAVDSNGNKLYHKADGCPAPKIFDEYCAHDDRYISECYCPTYYQYDCTFPYRGDERVREHGYASCDGLFIACCDTRCPSGTSEYDPGGCGGSTTNDRPLMIAVILVITLMNLAVIHTMTKQVVRVEHILVMMVVAEVEHVVNLVLNLSLIQILLLLQILIQHLLQHQHQHQHLPQIQSLSLNQINVLE